MLTDYQPVIGGMKNLILGSTQKYHLSVCVFLVGGLNLKDWKIVGRGLDVCILHAQTHIFKDFYHLIHFIGRSVMKQVLPLIL